MAFSVGVLIEGISEVIDGISEVAGACDVDGVLEVDGASFSLVLQAVNVLIPMIAAPPASRAI